MGRGDSVYRRKVGRKEGWGGGEVEESDMGKGKGERKQKVRRE